MDKLVSVIVAVYNEEKYIVGTIESILAQTYKELEIILVDDGSTDKSPSICDVYREKDSRVKVIHKENGGLPSSRNAGIQLASGDYIAFVDGDDLIHETFIETLYKLCESNDCDIAMCDFLMITDHSQKLLPQKTKKVEIFSKLETMDRLCENMNIIRYWITWDKIYRRELFNDVEYPVGVIHEDMYTTYKLLWKSKKTAVTNLYLYYYLQREDSLTGRTSDIKNSLDIIGALKAQKLFFYSVNLTNEYIFMLYKYYYAIKSHFSAILNEKSDGENREVTEILNTLKEMELQARKEILTLPQKSMIDKLRSIYSSLNKEEQDSYLKIYGDKIAYVPQEIYSFPSEKIARNDHIALYGAGAVGKAYYQQILNIGDINLAVWVDNSWKNYIREGYPVKPIDALFSADFDKIVIAVKNPEVAKEVVENLVGWGIEESKIIYEQPVVGGSQVRTEHIMDTQRLKASDKRRWVVMNTPDHDNLGDHALTIGTLNYLQDYFPSDEVIEISGRQWDVCKNEIQPKISKKDVIIIVGGGYMGDLWPVQDDRVKEIIQAFSANKIIFFPQTFFYTDSEESILNSDKQFYNRHKNILFIHREKISCERFIKDVVSDASRNECYPDLALYLNDSNKPADRKKILLCLRLDKESTSIGIREKLINICDVLGESTVIIDTVLNRSVGKSERHYEVSCILDKISHAKLIITDRLHAMIFAVITGTPCITFDNLSHKVKGVYEWIKELDYICCIGTENINKDLIIKYLHKDINKYSRSILEKEFDAMAQRIKVWVEKE